MKIKIQTILNIIFFKQSSNIIFVILFCSRNEICYISFEFFIFRVFFYVCGNDCILSIRVYLFLFFYKVFTLTRGGNTIEYQVKYNKNDGYFLKFFQIRHLFSLL